MRRYEIAFLLLCSTFNTGCATLGVQSSVGPVELLPGTPAHLHAQKDLQKKVDRAVRRNVSQTGACKVQAHQTGRGKDRARRFLIECVGDSRYEAQVVNAVRDLTTPQLTHFRFIVASPGWADVMGWNRRIGRQTQFAIYDPGLSPLAHSSAPHDHVVLSASGQASEASVAVQAQPVGMRVGQGGDAMPPIRTPAYEGRAVANAASTAPEMDLPASPETRFANDRIRSINQADGVNERWFVKVAIIGSPPTNVSVDLLKTDYAYSVPIDGNYAIVSPGFRTREEAAAFAQGIPEGMRTPHLEVVSYQMLLYASKG